MEALDVKTALLYAKLDKEIYMRQPEGFVIQGQEQKVLYLLCEIYGLKQAALAWWKELESSMKILDFTHASSDAGVFLIVKNKKLVIAVIYVDNAIFFGKDKQVVKQVKQTFMDIWECHDIGKAKEFLRMKIQHKGKNIYLNQMSYLTKVVEHFGMRNA